MSRFNPASYTVATARPIPVILLLDTSGSMHGDRIKQLNEAVSDMLQSFKHQEKMETTIEVSIITFGKDVNFHLTANKADNTYFRSASEIEWEDLKADGMTPMGTAIKMAKGMLEDKTIIPSNAYRPTVVLISDGNPTDDWQNAIQSFISEGRSAKCDRMSLGIGADFAPAVLNQFKSDQHELFIAKDAKEIASFFKAVTMSVTSRMNSNNINAVEVTIKNEIPKDNTPIPNIMDDEDDVF